ncbi:hypothetical protein AMJ47_03510 [Parcubacteria bacterium DG_72]|nr:MAG: hypothetical protein AMJ47_03510 [Parcubacteria bacterium DG_72]
MYYYLLIFYLAGLLQDFLTVLWVRFISEGKTLPAVVLSFITVLISLLVIYNIITQLEAQKSTPAIIVYALGFATGTFFAMKIKKRI